MSRKIEEIRNGAQQGPINSYVNSSNVAALNPFVLWDHFYIPDTNNTAGFGFHGHSGVATISYPQAGDIEHADTGNHKGTLYAGGVQIMSAGAGVLHKETVLPEQHVADAFQLWVALPADEQEMGPVVYSTAQKNALPIHAAENGASTKIIVGQYEGLTSPVQAPVEMTYLHVRLKANTQWHYPTEPGQTTAMIYVRTGSVATGDSQISATELGIYEQSNGAISIEAGADETEFLIIAGTPLKQAIISNGSSIHSSTENLISGVQNINQLHKQMAQA